MQGNEIVELINNNLSAIVTPITAVASALFTAFFFRNKTDIEEFEKVKAGKLAEVADDLLASGKMSYMDFYKAKNFLQIAKIADENNRKEYHPKNEKLVIDENFRFDWYVKFYEASGNVTEEDIQIIWAKLLCGEVNKPGSISTKVIEVMKNMDVYEAELFEKVLSHSVVYYNAAFFPNYKNLLKKADISYNDILYLDELGLIYADSLLIFEQTVEENFRVLIGNETLVLLGKSNKESSSIIRIKQFPFTTVGRQLAHLIGEKFISEDDFFELANEIQKEKNVVLEIRRIREILDGEVVVDDANLLI